MFSGFNQALIALVVTVGGLGYADYALLSGGAGDDGGGSVGEPLRVCSDPNNLPFSNARHEGFENELATLIADRLHRPLEYAWWPQRRGFLKNTLNARKCDLVIGVPAHYDMVDTTHTYYTSSYVFVTKRDRGLDIESLDDPRLKSLRIGVHTIGDDYSNVPPVQSLARRGLANNVRGYPIYGAYSQPDPPRNLLDALSHDEIDVAIAWGPLAGYFASREATALDVTPIKKSDPQIPLRFSIAMGVRHGDGELKNAVDRVLTENAAPIDSLLRRYGVPLVAAEPRVARNSTGGRP